MEVINFHLNLALGKIMHDKFGYKTTHTYLCGIISPDQEVAAIRLNGIVDLMNFVSHLIEVTGQHIFVKGKSSRRPYPDPVVHFATNMAKMTGHLSCHEGHYEQPIVDSLIYERRERYQNNERPVVVDIIGLNPK
jgi:hypothetical protein